MNKTTSDFVTLACVAAALHVSGRRCAAGIYRGETTGLILRGLIRGPRSTASVTCHGLA